MSNVNAIIHGTKFNRFVDLAKRLKTWYGQKDIEVSIYNNKVYVSMFQGDLVAIIGNTYNEENLCFSFQLDEITSKIASLADIRLELSVPIDGGNATLSDSGATINIPAVKPLGLISKEITSYDDRLNVTQFMTLDKKVMKELIKSISATSHEVLFIIGDGSKVRFMTYDGLGISQIIVDVEAHEPFQRSYYAKPVLTALKGLSLSKDVKTINLSLNENDGFLVYADDELTYLVRTDHNKDDYNPEKYPLNFQSKIDFMIVNEQAQFVNLNGKSMSLAQVISDKGLDKQTCWITANALSETITIANIIGGYNDVTFPAFVKNGTEIAVGINGKLLKSLLTTYGDLMFSIRDDALVITVNGQGGFEVNSIIAPMALDFNNDVARNVIKPVMSVNPATYIDANEFYAIIQALLNNSDSGTISIYNRDNGLQVISGNGVKYEVGFVTNKPIEGMPINARANSNAFFKPSDKKSLSAKFSNLTSSMLSVYVIDNSIKLYDENNEIITLPFYVNDDTKEVVITNYKRTEFFNSKQKAVVTLTSDDFRNAVNIASKFAATDNNRPTINSVHFSFRKSEVEIVGTDGYRLSVDTRNNLAGTVDADGLCLEPNALLNTLKSIANAYISLVLVNDGDTVAIIGHDEPDNLTSDSSKTITYLFIIPGRFPDYSVILPAKSSMIYFEEIEITSDKITSNGDSFETVFERANKLSSDNHFLGVFTVKRYTSTVTFSVPHADKKAQGHALSLDIPAQNIHADYNIGVNIKYLLDAVKLSDKHKHMLYFREQRDYLIGKFGTVTYVIMPMLNA